MARPFQMTDGDYRNTHLYSMAADVHDIAWSVRRLAASSERQASALERIALEMHVANERAERKAGITPKRGT